MSEVTDVVEAPARAPDEAPVAAAGARSEVDELGADATRRAIGTWPPSPRAAEDLAPHLTEVVRLTGIGIFDHDHRSDTIYWSPELRGMYGVAGDLPASVGMFVDLVHEDDRGAIEAAIARAHDPAGDGRFDVVHRIRRADGQVRWIATRAQTTFDGGRPARTIGAVSDVTTRHIVSYPHQAQSMRMWDVVDRSLNEIYLFDADSLRFEHVNAGALRNLGYSLAQMRTMTPLDVKPAYTEAAFRAVLAPLLTGEVEKQVFTTEHRRSSGTSYPVEVHLQLVDRGGSPVFLAVATDITERQAAQAERARLQAQLVQAQKLETVGQLAGGIAHDFNNLLAVMMMTHTVLRARAGVDPEIQVILDDLEDATSRAADLTRQLLMFSRRSVMAKRPIELDGAIRALLKMLQRLVGEDITLRYLRGAVPAWIDADPGMLDQLLTNLCVNARDAMPRGGLVTITIDRIELDAAAVATRPDVEVGSYVCLVVADQGHGMDEETRARIFEPFFTTKPVGKGTGLGLSTVHGIARQHGGWVEVDSVVGQGTTFRVMLPARSDEVDLDDSRPMPLLSGAGEVLLLVEDDLLVRHAVATVLRERGFEVLVARDGREGMQHWAAHGERIRLLLTDLIMPGGMNGVELAERVRATRPELPIVIFSGYGPERLIEIGRAIGGVTYLPKPCAPHLLVRVLTERLMGF